MSANNQNNNRAEKWPFSLHAKVNGVSVRRESIKLQFSYPSLLCNHRTVVWVLFVVFLLMLW